jgi:hypothetical protein
MAYWFHIFDWGVGFFTAEEKHPAADALRTLVRKHFPAEIFGVNRITSLKIAGRLGGFSR